MKKTHYKKAIDRLFDKWPWQYGFDPERDIQQLIIEPACGEDGDPNQYAHVTAQCWPENCMYGKPMAITVTFNLTKK